MCKIYYKLAITAISGRNITKWNFYFRNEKRCPTFKGQKSNKKEAGAQKAEPRGNKQPWVSLLDFCAKCNDSFDSWKFCI
jgi:hypothetical protein